MKWLTVADVCGQDDTLRSDRSPAKSRSCSRAIVLSLRVSDLRLCKPSNAPGVRCASLALLIDSSCSDVIAANVDGEMNEIGL